jgi:hypothetical protein
LFPFRVDKIITKYPTVYQRFHFRYEGGLPIVPLRVSYKKDALVVLLAKAEDGKRVMGFGGAVVPIFGFFRKTLRSYIAMVERPRAWHQEFRWSHLKVPNHLSNMRLSMFRGFYASRHADHLPDRDFYLDSRFMPIEPVKPRGVEPVFDITVEGSHSYVANGVVVHNSSLFKATEAILKNSTSDKQFRRGTAGFSYEMTVDGHALRVQRTKKELTFGYQGPTDDTFDYKEKIGKAADVAEIFPQFPLRPIRLKDSWFVPNLVKQGQIPIFDQVDITELFSVLYEDVAKVTGRLDRLKKELAASNKEMSANEAKMDFLAKQANGFDTELLSLDVEAIKTFREPFSAFLKLLLKKSETNTALETGAKWLTTEFPFFSQWEGAGQTVEFLAGVFARFQGSLAEAQRLNIVDDKLILIEQQLVVIGDIDDKALTALGQSLARASQAAPLSARLAGVDDTVSQLDKSLQALPEFDGSLLTAMGTAIARLSAAVPLVNKLTATTAALVSVSPVLMGLAHVEEHVARVEVIKDLARVEQEYNRLENESVDLAGEIFALLEQLSNVDICPLCGSKTDLKGHLSHGLN